VTSDTPVRDIETMMIEQNQKFMPVLEGNKVIGAITRTDLLRMLYEEFLKKRRIDKEDTTGPHFSSRNLRDGSGQVSGGCLFCDEAFRRDRRAAGIRRYLVGGSVRDLLMGSRTLI